MIVIGIATIETIAPGEMVGHLVDFLEWLIKHNNGDARLFAEHKLVTGVMMNLVDGLNPFGVFDDFIIFMQRHAFYSFCQPTALSYSYTDHHRWSR